MQQHVGPKDQRKITSSLQHVAQYILALKYTCTTIIIISITIYSKSLVSSLHVIIDHTYLDQLLEIPQNLL